VFIDHSPPSADTAAAGLLLCWRGHRISTVSVGHVSPGGGLFSVIGALDPSPVLERLQMEFPSRHLIFYSTSSRQPA